MIHCLSFLLILGQRYEILSFFRMADGGHVGFRHQEGTKSLNSNITICRMFVMPVLVRNDNLFVILAHLGPEI